MIVDEAKEAADALYMAEMEAFASLLSDPVKFENQIPSNKEKEKDGYKEPNVNEMTYEPDFSNLENEELLTPINVRERPDWLSKPPILPTHSIQPIHVVQPTQPVHLTQSTQSIQQSPQEHHQEHPVEHLKFKQPDKNRANPRVLTHVQTRDRIHDASMMTKPIESPQPLEDNNGNSGNNSGNNNGNSNSNGMTQHEPLQVHPYSPFLLSSER